QAGVVGGGRRGRRWVDRVAGIAFVALGGRPTVGGQLAWSGRLALDR
ncbi:MAG: hypothetical protein HOY78_25955, partial [Saccharothrix sp.]|nr:hypothetical protein [Saccharothrix sp.]